VLESHAELAEKHKVELRQQLCPHSVPGDPVLLERLIADLVANTILHNEPSGWAELTIEAQPAITVSNSGEHIPAEEVPALFEPFRRLGTDSISHTGGVGLGPSIVRSIATAHQGSIHARARPEGGLTITIDLPPGHSAASPLRGGTCGRRDDAVDVAVVVVSRRARSSPPCAEAHDFTHG
jgi:signal transduction histidine kinase